MSKRERNKALIQHALTQHLCLSWFQMNKAEYQVAHLYTMQRQIDQSITAGCCWITNALWCLCVYKRQFCFFVVFFFSPPPYLLCLECICVDKDNGTMTPNSKFQMCLVLWHQMFLLLKKKKKQNGDVFNVKYLWRELVLNVAGKIKSVGSFCAKMTGAKVHFHLHPLSVWKASRTRAVRWSCQTDGKGQ